MQIGFVYPHNIAGRFISWFTWGKFSHVFVWRKPYLVESAPLKGVRVIRAFDETDIPYEDIELVTVADNEKAFRAMCKQTGAGYDYSGIFGFLFRRDWLNDEDKWFCSELIARGYQKAGAPFIKRKTNRVTPQDLWEMTPFLK